MKLYGVSDGPPSFACRMVLKALNIPHELVPVNYNVGEHLTDEYFKVYKQAETFNFCDIDTFVFDILFVIFIFRFFFML